MKDNSAENNYIQISKLDEKQLNQSCFLNKEQVSGGTLILNMGNKPAKDWESDPKIASTFNVVGLIFRLNYIKGKQKREDN